MRNYYLKQLTDVVMIDPRILAAERLGGADYDGDMFVLFPIRLLMNASAVIIQTPTLATAVIYRCLLSHLLNRRFVKLMTV